VEGAACAVEGALKSLKFEKLNLKEQEKPSEGLPAIFDNHFSLRGLMEPPPS
jgi:hypothetical protein